MEKERKKVCLKDIPSLLQEAFDKGVLRDSRYYFTGHLDGTFISQLSKNNDFFGNVINVMNSGGVFRERNLDTFVELIKAENGRVYFASMGDSCAVAGEVDAESIKNIRYFLKHGEGDRVVVPCIEPKGYSIGIHRH